MYKYKKPKRSKFNQYPEILPKETAEEYKKRCMEEQREYSAETVEGESIETKIERILENKEPISDGAPTIFTEKKDGVLPAYNIRTDRWEIAAEAMDKIHKQNAAKRESKGAQKEEVKSKLTEEAKTDPKDGVAESNNAK